MSVYVTESSYYAASKDSMGKKNKRTSAPEEYSLETPTPNPTRKKTQIQFALPEATDVTLVVYDVMGRVVTRLVDQRLQPGHKNISFDATGLSSGTYLYRLRTEHFVRTRRLTVVR